MMLLVDNQGTEEDDLEKPFKWYLLEVLIVYIQKLIQDKRSELKVYYARVMEIKRKISTSLYQEETMGIMK
jgi:hypothetical protein